MNLIYYCSKYSDAPGTVSSFIFANLLKHNKTIPFRKIYYYGYIAPYISDVCDYNLHRFQWSYFLRENNFVVHIAVSPNIFPNKKFLLILSSILLKKHMIIHYHGDVRKHLSFVLEHHQKVKLSDIINAIFIPTILKLSSKVIVHSYSMEKIVEDYGVKKSIVIPNGIDDFWFESLTDEPKILHSLLLKDLSSTKKVFYHGRLSPEKGVDLLLKSFSIYLKSYGDSHLLIAGTGTQYNDLLNLVDELEITDNVTFLGNLSKESIKYFLKNVDVAIYPSRFDAFCLAAVEALACSNCPVYFSRDAGLNDFVIKNNFNLNTFVPGIESIINILHSISHNSSENDLMSQKNFANQFKWGLIINEYLSLYQDVISNANY